MAKLILQPIMKPDSNKLREAYEVAADVQRKIGTVTVTVPKFFQYDGSSLPIAAWPIMGTPFSPRLMTASVFHDWIYHTHQVARKTADKLFHQILLEDGVDGPLAWIMKTAVEDFGQSSWANDNDDKAYIARLTARIVADNRKPADYSLPPKA